MHSTSKKKRKCVTELEGQPKRHVARAENPKFGITITSLQKPLLTPTLLTPEPKPEPKAEKIECVICTDTFDQIDALHFGGQAYHLPCLIEILKTQASPKDPFSNKPLPAAVICEIEKRGKEMKIWCPPDRYRNLYFSLENEIKELENLIDWIEDSEGKKQCQTFLESVRTILWQNAEGKITACGGALPHFSRK